MLPGVTSTAPPTENHALDTVSRSMQTFGRMVAQGRVIEAVLKRAGVDLTRADVQLLHTLLDAGEGIRLGELAERLLVDAPTVTRRVQQLESRGLVRRTTDPIDRRAQLVHLTPAGTRIIERGMATFHSWLEQVLAHWSDDERVALGRLLERFTHDVYAELDGHGH
jgi:DNA-binding MarR family transcriptional regulator